MCPGPNVTEYDGGENNNTPIPLKELLEFRKRTDEGHNPVIDEDVRSVRIQNLILENIDTNDMDEDDLKLLHFKGDNVAGNIMFKGGNLSKMQYIATTGPVNLTFDNAILPQTMADSNMKKLILKNATLPKELKTAQLNYILSGLPYKIGTLKIYNLKGRFLYKWTEEEIQQAKKQWKIYGNNIGNVPLKYVGPKDILEKLKLLCNEGTTKTHFTNEDFTDVDDENINFSSIQKQQSQLLALLQTQNKYHG